MALQQAIIKTMQANPITPPHNPGRFTTWAANNNGSQNIIVRAVRSLCRIVMISFNEYTNNDLSLRSAALTYTILLSLVPMLAMSTAVLKGFGGGDQLQTLVYGYIDTLESNQISPITALIEDNTAEEPPINEELKDKEETEQPANITKHLRSAADQLFDYVNRTNFATLGTFGVVGIMLSVILVLSHIETAMNSIWHVENGRSLMRKVADYLTLIVLLPISINVGFASSAVLSNQAMSSKLDIIMPAPWFQAIIFQLIPVFFIAITLYILYLFFPNTKVRTIPALIGAALAAAMWFLTQNVYISLQVGVSKYNAIYGSFATVPLFLIWIYFGWLFILAGAQLAYAIQNQASYPLVQPRVIPSMSLSAAFDIMDEIYENHRKATILDEQALANRFSGYDPAMLREVLDQLISQKLIYVTNEDNGLVPAMPNELLDRQKIITAILGTTTPATSGGEKSKKIIDEVLEFKAVDNQNDEDDLPIALAISDKQPEETTTIDQKII